MEKKDRKKPNFTLLCTLLTAALLAGLCLFAMLTGRHGVAVEDSDGSGSVVQVEELQPEILRLEPTPEPTPVRYPMPEGAVEILSDGVPVLTLSSRAEAEAALTEYLAACMTDEENERALHATFDCELLIVEASGVLQLSERAAAVARLLETPSLVPVLLETERREVQAASDTELQTREDAALAKGTRIVSQFGAPAYVATTTQLTYRAGELVSGGDPASETLTEARATIVRTGTYASKTPNEEPGKDEGEAGRDAGDLDFAAPIRNGRISSYFGTRNGEMHWGVDYQVRAGTQILAPEEGIIVYCGERGEYGFVIDIDHGNGFVSRLTHCDEVEVELHQRVFRGEVVAVLAEPDDVDEQAHLHYELLIDSVPHNPVPYL